MSPKTTSREPQNTHEAPPSPKSADELRAIAQATVAAMFPDLADQVVNGKITSQAVKQRHAQPAPQQGPAEAPLVYLGPATEFPNDLVCPRCWPCATYLKWWAEQIGRDPLKPTAPWNVELPVTPDEYHWFWMTVNPPKGMLDPGISGFFAKFEYGWHRTYHLCGATRFESKVIQCGSCRDKITITIGRDEDNQPRHADVAAALEGRGWVFTIEYGWSYHDGPEYHAQCPKHSEWEKQFPRKTYTDEPILPRRAVA